MTRRVHLSAAKAVIAIVVGCCGTYLIGPGARPATAPTGTALVIADEGGRQVLSVLDGPEPGRHVVDWAGDTAPGATFTVGLAGDCRCAPYPAELVPTSHPRRGVQAFGALLVLLSVANLVYGVVWVRRRRAVQDRLVTRAGQGTGRTVRLVPRWARKPPPLHAELWDGGHLVGVIALGLVEEGFDPTPAFTAWGDLTVGGEVALTSVDSRQLVVPTAAILAPEAAPAIDGSILAARALGWPTAPGGESDGTRTDAAARAMDDWRKRSRWAVVIAIVVASALGVVLVHLDEGAVTLVAAVAMCAGARPALFTFTRRPVLDLVAADAGTASPAEIRRAADAVIWARHLRPRTGRSSGAGDRGRWDVHV